MTIRVLFLTLFYALLVPLSIAQTTGRITGTVIGGGGETLDQMRICTSVTSGNSTGISCYTPVDAEGHFEIAGLKFGTYEIFAINEDEGYSIENQRPGLKVTVAPENAWQNVTIRQHPRGGILTGSVRDKVTGKAVEDAWVNYTMLDDGNGGGTRRVSNGQFSIAVPAESRLLVYVYARGYRGWIYTDASQPFVTFASGERRVLDVELEALPKPSGAH
jgi:hypothetical protein